MAVWDYRVVVEKGEIRADNLNSRRQLVLSTQPRVPVERGAMRFLMKMIAERPAIFLGALLLLAGLAGLFGLDRSPTVWTDEVTYADPAYRLATTGQLTSQLGVLGTERAYFLQPPGFFIFQAGVFRVFGFGIWQVRLPGIGWYLVSAGLIFWIVRRIAASDMAGLVCAFLFICDPNVVQTVRSGRMDSMAVAIGLGSLALVIRARRAGPSARMRRSLVGLGGFAGGVGILIHPNVICLVFAGVLALVMGRDKLREGLWDLFALGMGVVAGLSLWLPSILSNWSSFQEHFLRVAFSFSVVGGSQVSSLAAGNFKNCILSYWIFPLSLFVQTIAIPISLIYPRTRIAGVLALWGITFGYFLQRTSHPFIYMLPLTVMPVGFIGTHLWANLTSRKPEIETQFQLEFWKRVGIFSLILVTVNGLAVLGMRATAIILQWDGRSHDGLVENWKRIVPKHRKVAGPSAGYYAAILNENPYRLAEPILNVHKRSIPHEVVRARWEYSRRLIEEGVEYLVLHKGRKLEDVLLPRDEKKFFYIASIQRTLPPIAGVRVGSYEFEVYRRRP